MSLLSESQQFKTQTQSSQFQSINSSDILDNQSNASKTQSMAKSINQLLGDELCQTAVKQNKGEQKNTKEQMSSNKSQRPPYQFSSIEKPRLAQNFNDHNDFDNLFSEKYENTRKSNSFVGFVGFVQGGNKKPITINQSKMKKAKQFFQSQKISQSNSDEDFQNLSSELSSEEQDSVNVEKILAKKYNRKKQKEGDSSMGSFSVGFTNAGTGSQIQISQENSEKAKLFFKQFEDQSINLQVKPKTKIKLHQRENGALNNKNLLKTVTFQEKRVSCFQKAKKIKQKNKAKQTISNQRMIISELNIKPLRTYRSLKFSELPQITLANIQQFDHTWRNLDYQNESFLHKLSECTIINCYFCKKTSFATSQNKQNLEVNKKTIITQLMKIINISKNSNSQQTEGLHQLLDNLYKITMFKLLKYHIFYSQLHIENKLYNPNNILIEIFKKYTQISKNSPDLIPTIQTKFGPLASSIAQLRYGNSKVLGKSLNLIVLDIQQNDEIKCFYIQLCDGWSVCYAVISQKNQLYELFKSEKNNKTLYIGQKICISDWNLYFVQNILDYHPTLNSNKKKWAKMVIQFNYNNSRKIPYNSKLGFSKDIVYRPLHKQKISGGNIPLVEGITLRMLTRKNNGNKPNQYFLELLIEQNQTILIKFPLAQQMALSDYFTLHTCYQFRKIKLNKHNNGEKYLQFCDKSAFYEIKNEQKIQKVLEILKKRLLNFQKSNQALSKQLQKKYIDIIITNKEFKILDFQFEVEEKIYGAKPTLLQQFTLQKNSDKYILRRGDRGALLTRLPGIYKNIDYTIF